MAAFPLAPRGALSALRSDGGAILLSSLVKFVVAIALVGVVGYDTLSIVHRQVTTRDDAQQTAQVAHDALRDRQTPQQAYAAALAYAEARDAKILHYGVAKDGTVTITLTATAKTFVAGRIPPLQEYVSPVVTVTARNSVY